MNAPIALYAWQGRPNFGDALSREVAEYALGRPVHLVSDGHRGKLLAVGSVLDKAFPEDAVWGSGIHPAYYDQTWRIGSVPGRWGRRRRRSLKCRASILALRGPVTRDALRLAGLDAPGVYGDPAILLPRLYRPEPTEIVHDVGVVHHYGVDTSSRGQSSGMAHLDIDVGQPWRQVVDQMLSCRTVISSSLHGIIVAEAYGKPAILRRHLGQGEGLVKYLDYYLSTDRVPFVLDSPSEFSVTRLLRGWVPPENLEQLGNGLLEAASELDVERVLMPE